MRASYAPAIATDPLAMRTTAWDDYGLIDSGDGRKLERYGQVRVVRPEPQCLWAPELDAAAWAAADAVFDPTDEDEAGRWRFARPLAETWPLAWRGVRFQRPLHRVPPPGVLSRAGGQLGLAGHCHLAVQDLA